MDNFMDEGGRTSSLLDALIDSLGVPCGLTVIILQFSVNQFNWYVLTFILS